MLSGALPLLLRLVLPGVAPAPASLPGAITAPEVTPSVSSWESTTPEEGKGVEVGGGTVTSVSSVERSVGRGVSEEDLVVLAVESGVFSLRAASAFSLLLLVLAAGVGVEVEAVVVGRRALAGVSSWAFDEMQGMQARKNPERPPFFVWDLGRAVLLAVVVERGGGLIVAGEEAEAAGGFAAVASVDLSVEDWSAVSAEGVGEGFESTCALLAPGPPGAVLTDFVREEAVVSSLPSRCSPSTCSPTAAASSSSSSWAPSAACAPAAASVDSSCFRLALGWR